MLILERIEGDWAIIEQEGIQIKLPIGFLPVGAAEGDCLVINVTVDAEATQERKERMKKRMGKLFS